MSLILTVQPKAGAPARARSSLPEIRMPTFKLAHIREQGQNMLLFPLSGTFSQKTSHEQQSILAELEDRAHAAGLAGRAVIFWESGGRTHSLGPKPWANFLRSLSMQAVLASVNKSVSW